MDRSCFVAHRAAHLPPNASVLIVAAVAASLRTKDKSINKSVIRNMTCRSACRISGGLRAQASRLMINYEDLGLFMALIFPAAPAHILLAWSSPLSFLFSLTISPSSVFFSPSTTPTPPPPPPPPLPFFSLSRCLFKMILCF